MNEADRLALCVKERDARERKETDRMRATMLTPSQQRACAARWALKYGLPALAHMFMERRT